MKRILASLASIPLHIRSGRAVFFLVPLAACGGSSPSSKTAADVDEDSNAKPTDTAAAAGEADAGGGATTASSNTAPAPGSADDSTGPKKDECTVFDEPNLEGVLLKSACEAPSPTGQPPDTSKTLVVKVTASPNIVAPGGHADLLVSYTNKSAAPLPLYFTIDPMPRFEIETYTAKGGNRVDKPKNTPPPLPAGVAPREPGEAKIARIVLTANGTARMPLGWDAVKMRWAPEKLKGTPPEKGYPRAPAGSLPKGTYSVKVVTPLTYVFEGIDHEVSAPRVDIVVKK